MVKDEIKAILAEENSDFNKVIGLLCNEKIELKTKQKYIDEYDLKHEILKRPDKIVKKKIKDESGRITTKQVPEPVARIVLAYQKKIVEYAVAFLFGKPLNIESTDKSETFIKFKDIWESLKMNSVLKDVARRTMIETEAAIIFYPEIKSYTNAKNKVVETKKLRAKVLAYKYGDEIYPFFDEYGDLEAFTRKYEITDVKTKKANVHFDIYFDNLIIKAVKNGDIWDIKSDVNKAGKIPVVYFAQEKCEWNDVQNLVDREESHRSRLGDTNDYFGSPSLVVKGKLKTAPDKSDNAKVFELEGDDNPNTGKKEYGDIDYLVYDKDTESVELEHKLNDQAIHSFTFTPHITLETLKNMGNTSGVALEIMFYDALLKASNNQEIFGANIARIINLLKVMISVFIEPNKAFEDLKVEFQFSNPLPSNIEELINVLSIATGSKAIMSQEDAVNKNPLVNDKAETISKLKEEQLAENEKNSKIENSYN